MTGQFRKFVETREHLIVLVLTYIAQSFLPSNNKGLWEVKLLLFNSHPIGNRNWPDMVVYGVCAGMAFEYAR